MAELADALDLGSSVHRRAGSSPVTRTIEKGMSYDIPFSIITSNRVTGLEGER